jgi:ubiquinone biosynthesis protein Coq4
MAGKDDEFEYIHKRTRNPLLVARAAWRLVRNLGATPEATILEDYFSRSHWMKKYSRWDLVGERLLPGEYTEQQLAALPRLPHLDLDALEAACAPGTLGYTVATHMKRCGLNPNIFRPADVRTKEDYAVVHITETHDIWHVVTGFGNDEPGEIGVIAFYCSHTGASIFVLLLAAALLNTALFSHDRLQERFDAIAEGWNAGKRARPMFGIDWTTQWHRPIEEVRRELQLPAKVEAGVGVLANAA